MKIASYLAAIFLLLAVTGGASAEPKRVLLLHSFGNQETYWSEFASIFSRQLVEQSFEPIDIFEVTLFFARDETFDNGPLREYLFALSRQRPLDLVVTIGPPAIAFAQNNRALLFPNVPLLHAAAEARNAVVSADAVNETAVSFVLDLRSMMEVVLQTLPKTEHVAVVLGDSPVERRWIQELRRAYAPLENRVNFIWMNESGVPDMLKKIAQLPPNSAIQYFFINVDANGVPQEELKILSQVRQAANAPVFGFLDAQIGRGVVGGSLLSIGEVSTKTADSALRLLRGESPQNVKVNPITPAPIYDWRELNKWKISEANLPANSIVQFRSPTFWNRYRWILIGILAVVLLQATMITTLLVERRRRRLAEMTSRRRFLELSQMNRSLTVSTMSSSIAHELNQPLGAILNNAEAAEILLNRNPPDIIQLREILADIRQDDRRAGDIINHLRGFLKKGDLQLREVDLGRVIEDVLHIVEPEASKRGIAVYSEPAKLQMTVRADHIHLQQVLLNLALNAMDAMIDRPNGRRMRFQAARLTSEQVQVSVLDDGTGIPEHELDIIFESFVTTKRHGTGLGLSIARTIVEMYGGKIWAENRAGGGAALCFVLPSAEAVS